MTKPANVLVIMSDEHNARVLGAAGDRLARTPHLDALAARGTRFENAYSNCPICVPSRASFATGRYVHDIGYWDNSIAYDGRVESWGHVLQRNGIPVESIGKLHYRSQGDPTGFDRQILPMHIKDGHGMVQLSIRQQFPDFAGKRKQVGGIPKTAGVGESEYTAYDRRVADAACEWLRARPADGGPWVLFVSFVTPHYPLVAPQKYFDLHDPSTMPEPKLGWGSGYAHHPWLRELVPPEESMAPELHRRAYRAYLALCSFMDDQVGRVLGALRACGLEQDTRVIYTADHGESAGARGLWGKSNLYEEAVKVPFVIAGPGVAAGALCETPVSLVDAFPSILHGAGVRFDADTLPGRSVFQICQEPDDPGRMVFSEYHAAFSPSAGYMLRWRNFKLNYYVGFEPELFDLANDPGELRSLAGDPAHGAVLREMTAALRRRVDPEAVDRQANEAQRALVESLGGPAAVLEKMEGMGIYTPVPLGMLPPR